MKLISYQTWKKYHYGTPLTNGYNFCAEDYGYGMFKSKHPKDIAKLIIHHIFTEEEINEKEFVYIPHYYRGHNSLMDRLIIYYKNK